VDSRSGRDSVPWWRRGVIYQLYPRSFADGDGDGVGDLVGIRSRLAYVNWLGVDGVWLSPVYPSPMADFGYDVSDYCDIDRLFGDLAEFDRLVADCHALDLRVLLDWVPNHTSDQHPWFLDARSSRGAPHRDWYLWRGDDPNRTPNNWPARFGGPAWTWDEHTHQWYLHTFLPEQPDLNWANAEVVEAQHDVLRFWLDRGVDGFRADVVHLIGKDPALPDLPPARAGTDIVGTHDDPRTHPLLRGIRAVLDSYPGERTMVGEVNLRSARLLAPYYGDGDELPLVFNFSLLDAPFDGGAWRARVEDAEQALASRDAWPVWVLSNHDQVRQRTRYGGSERRARVAAVVLLTLRGTPFLYAGEELGLEDAHISADERVDPGGRDGCRAPIPWTSDPAHGWPVAPWLPWPPHPDTQNAETLSADSLSILWLYRRLLALRKRSPALHQGEWCPVEAPDGTLVYERRCGDDRRMIVANFKASGVELDVDGDWDVELASDSSFPRRWDRWVDGEIAVVLRPCRSSAGVCHEHSG
jgi:alpha-glucosidase